MTDKFQALMDRAYARWQKHAEWDQQDFWDQLDADERFVVFLGNMNYQVENGGFSQWWGNGYATAETLGYIQRACKRIGTATALQVANLVDKADRAYRGRREQDMSEREWEELSEVLDALDTGYYVVSKQFMADAEAYITKSV